MLATALSLLQRRMRGNLGRLQGATAQSSALGAQQPSYEGLLPAEFSGSRARSLDVQGLNGPVKRGVAQRSLGVHQLCNCLTSLSLRRPIFKMGIMPAPTPQMAYKMYNSKCKPTLWLGCCYSVFSLCPAPRGLWAQGPVRCRPHLKSGPGSRNLGPGQPMYRRNGVVRAGTGGGGGGMHGHRAPVRPAIGLCQASPRQCQRDLQKGLFYLVSLHPPQIQRSRWEAQSWWGRGELSGRPRSIPLPAPHLPSPD